MTSQPPVPPVNPPDPGAPSVPPPFAPPPFAPPPAAAPPLPWDQPGAPLLEAFFATIRLVLFRPREAFARMATTGGLARPLIFGLLLGVIGICVGASYDWILGDPMDELLSRFSQAETPDIPRFAAFLIAVIGSPLFAGLAVIFSAALYHLFLLILGGSGGGFGATFRVTCYSMAGNVWIFLPFVGSLVAGVWIAVAAVFGLAAVHRIGFGKAIAAVVLPVALCCICCLPFLIFGLLGKVMG